MIRFICDNDGETYVHLEDIIYTDVQRDAHGYVNRFYVKVSKGEWYGGWDWRNQLAEINYKRFLDVVNKEE